MNRKYALKKYTDLTCADASCERARCALISLKNAYDFKPRIVARIDKAIEAMDVITTVLSGLKNIEEQEILSPTYQNE
ncbi:MAG: hypothetical protein IJU23_10975 [Proteobacteria bacterium]|nr:hypothetical protein [Pseudomonadota bacterium]